LIIPIVAIIFHNFNFHLSLHNISIDRFHGSLHDIIYDNWNLFLSWMCYTCLDILMMTAHCHHIVHVHKTISIMSFIL